MAEPSQGPGAPADAGTGGQAPQGTQPPATPPAQQQPTGQAPATQQPEGSSSMTLEAAQKVIDDLRKENAKHRTDKQSSSQQAQAAQQQLDAVLKALGKSPDGSDAPLDPAALAAEVTQQQAIAWENAAENAILRVASTAGADADALLDSTTFLDSLGDFIALDPKSAEFRTKLQAHITVWVDKHPKHKAAGAVTATRSGGDHPGGTGTPTTRPKSLHAAVAKAYGGK
jgi:enamine deaminase RidA (YjgF/YER057c/UK114 family)